MPKEKKKPVKIESVKTDNETAEKLLIALEAIKILQDSVMNLQKNEDRISSRMGL